MIAKAITKFSTCMLAITLTAGCGQSPGKEQTAVNLRPRVADQAGLLSPKTEVILTARLEKLERVSGPQFVVVTVNSLEGQAIEDYSINLARKWAIGDRDRNDGVMLLVAPNERKIRIEVGYGLEGTLPNTFCAEIIEDKIVPAFEEGQFEQGILDGSEALIAKMKLAPTIELNDNEPLNPKERKIAS